MKQTVGFYRFLIFSYCDIYLTLRYRSLFETLILTHLGGGTQEARLLEFSGCFIEERLW